MNPILALILLLILSFVTWVISILSMVFGYGLEVKSYLALFGGFIINLFLVCIMEIIVGEMRS